MGYRSYPKAHTQFRIVCANEEHKFHCHDKTTLAKAEESARRNNVDAVFTDDPIPDKQGCLPWTVEVRMVTGWATP